MRVLSDPSAASRELRIEFPRLKDRDGALVQGWDFTK
jgi:hypothetical protein